MVLSSFPYMPRLCGYGVFCPFITNDAIVVVLLFKFVKVNRIDAANT